MNYRKEKTIFRKLQKKGFMPKHVAEVGVYQPETSNVYDYIQMDVRTTLVEPDPRSIELIKEHFSGMNNITLHQVAIYERNGKIELAQRDASTFVSVLESSPAIVNDSYRLNKEDTFIVEAKKFDEIDDGSIDLLSVDVEGSEWYVIQNLVSRPAVISIETHGAIYVNPRIDDIKRWMADNDYIIWYKDKSDSIFFKRGLINVTFIDKAKLLLYQLYLKIRRIRKIVKKSVKKVFNE